MRVYIACNICRKRIYLNTPAKSRRVIANNWGMYFSVNCPHCHITNAYHANAVYAESSDGAAPGAVVGGLLGLVGGPLGILVGGALGAAISSTNENNEVNTFNNSFV